MFSGSERLAGIMADEALAAALVPWACPCDFGPGRRYQLVELIGVGRESLIYRATDRKLSSEGFAAQVAVKIASSDSRTSFEAVSARRITHPNVLAIIDQGRTAEGVAYIVAEYVNGGDLAGRPGPWAKREVAAFIAKLARGVQAIHSAGVVHCDLKPANILLTREGEPKIGDFDLCHAPSDPGAAWRGNLAFMAPEQLARGDSALTPPADIYALGGLLYWLLTGRGPNGAAADVVIESLPRRTEPLRPDIDPDLDRICGRALAIKPEERHHSAGELADDLERWLRHEVIPWTSPTIVRRATLWAQRQPASAAVLTVGLAIALVAGWYSLSVARAAQESVRVAESEIQAERIKAAGRAADLAENEVARLKEQIKSQIGYVYQYVTSHNPDELDHVLPMLVMLEWIVNTPALDEDLRTDRAINRVVVLRKALTSMEVQERPPSIEELFSRYCLAYYLLDQDSATEAKVQLAKLQESWIPRLHEKDPVVLEVSVMTDFADALEAGLQGAPAEEVRRGFEAAAARLGPSGHDPVRRLILRATARLLDG